MTKETVSEIRVRNISHRTYSQLKNIATYHGLTLSTYLKHHLVNLLANTPEHIKQFKKEGD